MFTGIIEELGTIRNLDIQGQSGKIRIGCKKVLQGTRIGDSIAVNGICLTVTEIEGETFAADVMAETVRRSALSGMGAGDRVDLERAMPAYGRFGGHIVSGHIDGVGVIRDIRREENAVWFIIGAPARILRYVIEKGSVAIDGISLTVAGVDSETFRVSIIPHTMQETRLGVVRVGDTVNLENDPVGKYVERLLGFNQAAGKGGPTDIDSGGERQRLPEVATGMSSFMSDGSGNGAGITLEFLAENGF